jgi:hypothetical protein
MIDMVERCTCSIPMHFRHKLLNLLAENIENNCPGTAPRLDKICRVVGTEPELLAQNQSWKGVRCNDL